MTAYPPVVFSEPDRPFWGFSEVLLTSAAFILSLFAVALALRPLIGDDMQLGYWTVFEQAVAYGAAFLVLKFLFSRHDEPLFASLGWTRSPFATQWLIVTGLALATVIILLELALQTPEVSTPFEKLLADPLSRVVIAVFGITLAPVIEELFFRGLVQPVLVSAFGVLPGILVTSAIFGSLHMAQNAAIWQSFVLITTVGFALGVVRHLSGSTKASTIVHMAYNALPFVAVLAQGPGKHS